MFIPLAPQNYTREEQAYFNQYTSHTITDLMSVDN